MLKCLDLFLTLADPDERSDDSKRVPKWDPRVKFTILSDLLHTLESTGAAILLATILPLIFPLSEKRTLDFGHPL